MTLKSNRYMKIETGSNSCEYPAAAYSKDKRQQIADEEAKSTILSSIGGNSSIIPGSSVLNLSMLKNLIDIIHKLPGVARVWLNDYDRKYSDLVKRKELLDQTIESLKYYSGSKEWATTTVCKTYDDLKEDIWDTDDTSDWTEDKFSFEDNVKVEGEDYFNNVTKVCRNRHRDSLDISRFKPRSEQEKLCKIIVSKRKEWRSAIVLRTNRLRKAIRDLKPKEWTDTDLSKQFSDKIGYFRPYPDDFISNLKDALNKDNCGDTPVPYPIETLKDLKRVTFNSVLWRRYMSRLVVVKFLESLGFKDDMRREIDDPDHPGQTITVDDPDFSDVSFNGSKSLANNVYWRKYVQSLSGVPAIKKGDTFLSSVAESATDALKGTVSVDDILKFKENFSWSEGKKGGILFGYNGTTYELKGQQITPLETVEPGIKYMSETSEGIDKWDKKRLVKFMDKLRAELNDI